MNRMKRREFIVGGGAAAAVGLTCFSKGIRAAVAAAQRAGKPLLTEKNLNAFIKANPLRLEKGQDASSEAIRDLNGFIQKHFYLTAAQSRELASVEAADMSKLTVAITDMREKKGSISVRILKAGASEEEDLFEAPAAIPPLLGIKIGIKPGHSDLLGWYILVTIKKSS